MARTDIQGDLLSDCDNIRRGPHTSRPTNPSVGDVWISEDIKKFFVCFVASNWTHVNPVDITGSVDGDFFAYDGATGFLKPKTVSALQYGLDANKPATPDVGNVYLATDTEIVYYCFTDDVWTPTYLPRTQIFDFQKDGNNDIQPVKLSNIFEPDGAGGLMPTIDGDEDPEFEIVSGEITPKV